MQAEESVQAFRMAVAAMREALLALPLEKAIGKVMKLVGAPLASAAQNTCRVACEPQWSGPMRQPCTPPLGANL